MVVRFPLESKTRLVCRLSQSWKNRTIFLYSWMQSSRAGLVSTRLNSEGIGATLHCATATRAVGTVQRADGEHCTLIDRKPRSPIDAGENV